MAQYLAYKYSGNITLSNDYPLRISLDYLHENKLKSKF